MARCLILIAGIALAAWLAGFMAFVQTVEGLDAAPVEGGETDAIVVLTGGSERLSTGVELLDAHEGKKLFVSGVHPGLAPERLLAGQPVSRELRACCVALGYAAGSTFGNASETRAWMKAQGYRSLRLVTANYHMPRSLLIFHAAMPEFAIVPHPIAPADVKLADWWERSGTASLLAVEYGKYLVAAVRLWFGPR